MSSFSATFTFLVITCLLYVAYRRILPRPIPGIRYNNEAIKNPLGDLPALREHERKTGEKMSWLPLQIKKLNSPIIQVFLNPFTKPWVVISEFRESQDILLRRTKEFDRSDYFGNIFKGITPDHHISMKSTDPQFKIHRRLIQDLMTPAFLNEVSAPQIYSAFSLLCDLWAEKARLAEGHPFSASDDFYKAALDAIWAVTFPFDLGDSAINTQQQLIAGMACVDDIPSDIDHPVVFPEPPISDAQNSILTLTESLESVVLSPIPRLTYSVLRRLPYMRKAEGAKEKMIATELEKAKDRLRNGSQEQTARCAMDDILRREFSAAQKEGRKANYDTRTVYDELFGLLIAGHDTTSTTATWGLKFLSDHQDVQRKLRDALRIGFPAAVAECRPPTAQEIAKAHIPYLNATQEEIIRKSMTASAVTRMSTVDTVILGHRIPKGTNVVLLGNGPDFVEPSMGGMISEDDRSKSCQSAKGRIGSWDPSDSHLFRPERWLSTDEHGREEFDPAAGPLLTFGLGPRGCFGRRMAYLELKIALTLLLWRFELQMVPSSLNSYQAVDKLTHQPRQCFLRLSSSPLHATVVE